MIAKIFVNKEFLKEISLSEETALNKNVLIPYFDEQKIKIKARNAVGTTPGLVQIYLPELDILISD